MTEQQQWYLEYGTTHKCNGVQNLLVIISVPENMYYIGKVVSVGKVMKNDTSNGVLNIFYLFLNCMDSQKLCKIIELLRPQD